VSEDVWPGLALPGGVVTFFVTAVGPPESVGGPIASRVGPREQMITGQLDNAEDRFAAICDDRGGEAAPN
jgi:hypothetical protein